MKPYSYIMFMFFGILFVPQLVCAQVDSNQAPEDNLGNVSDDFQNYFFEALKQKGIENYSRAVDALQQCLKLDKSKPVVYFELGKNYKNLENYIEAEAALQKAIAMQPDNLWFMDELYDVYHKQNNIEKAITVLKKLSNHHPDYKEDLASLYIKQSQYTEALMLLDQLDAQYGISASRANMRQAVFNASGNPNQRIAYLQKQIRNKPLIEDNYIKLIYRYSQLGKMKEAKQTAQQLLEKVPNSELVYLTLYKFYIEEGKIPEAIAAIKKVLNSAQIDAESKSKVIKDFVNFVSKNPKYESDLLEITATVLDDTKEQNNSNLGQYYLKNGNKTKALSYFKKELQQNPNDFNLIKQVLLLQIDTQAYEAVINDSNLALELYPAQPILYLINGVAHNKMGNYTNAIESLELGIEFLIDNPKIEADLYYELSIAYKGINNITKSEAFANKAKNLKTQQ